ncbi:tyrosine-protein kinase transmembrane receptor Ror-like [Hydractinia symbiolongicarpus]|uniref:tyrosine-protein kinase transmembrane receptor Ror-like n=1 Tax=Hydractinia symbiolongicarpus TaxID=13093 RepID=UPI00254CD633|nr:tyrosine-protein kinase transmembrane receptor Ror-like [Hydractinia symbiolongicarpus]
MKSFIINFYALVLIFQGTNCETRHNIQRRSTCSQCKDPKIKAHPKNITATLGERSKIVLRCRATGDPPPTIVWTKNNRLIDEHDKHYNVSNKNILKSGSVVKAVRSQLLIRGVHNIDYGLYSCVAKNQMGSVKSKYAFVSMRSHIANPDTIPGSSTYGREGDCTKNITLTCRPYLDPTRTIFKKSEAKYFLNGRTLTELASNLDSQQDITKRCLDVAIAFLCYYNFPYCDATSKQPKPISICRKDCIYVSNHVCSKELETAKKYATLSTVLPPHCNDLPTTNCTSMGHEMLKVAAFHNAKIKTSTITPHIGSTEKEGNSHTMNGADIDPSDNCYFGDGLQYRGVTNMSESNYPCVDWSRVDAENQYQRMLAGHNFCRNPKSMYDRPWCYVLVGNKYEYQYCEIPQCAIPVQSQTSSILYTIIPCLLFALALSLAIITLAWRRHKQHYYQSAPSSPKQVVPRVNPKIQELNREDLCDYRLLGDGSIGRVYTADYTGSKDGQTFTACVAVKAIIEKATSKQIEDFVREAETRANFKHENVIALVGVISKEEPLSLIYEYTEFGDLHEYLLRHSPNFSDAHANDDCAPLEYADLLVIATQIASGMSYLSTHAFVHKDLAVRNCVVVNNGIIKISDFSGLCDMYAGDYYRVPGRQPLPVRWMSPESISETCFTTASDVWAYGVVLWEIFSYGSRPFFGLSNYQAMERILDLDLLSCPENCPNVVFNMMLSCWETEANNRPAFVEIYNRLKSLHDITNCPSSMQLHPQSSMHSLPTTHTSNGHATRDVAPSSFHRPSISKSHEQSLHSRHSSNHSINSNPYPPSMHGSIPPSLLSMPQSGSIRNGCVNRNHSLPREAYHSFSRNGHHSLSRNSRQSLSREGHYPRDARHHNMARDIHYSYPHDDMRPPSNNGSHHPSSIGHPNGCHPPASYISSLQSYPSSVTGPPVSVFSRQPSSRTSSRATSIKSYDDGHHESAMGSHILYI